MSNFGRSTNSDGRIFASYPMPAKIDLLNEAPRRESLVEEQLLRPVGSRNPPNIELSPPTQVCYSSYEQQISSTPMHRYNNQTVQVTNQVSPPPIKTVTNNSGQNLTGSRNLNNAAIRAADLAAKEAKLMAEISSLHNRPYSPFQVPDKIDLTREQREVQMQYQNSPSPRPPSRASSLRCTSADLIDKEAKLMQDIAELERKPFNPQTMVVEREQWFEYPQDRPHDKQLTESRRRIKDFCSLPENMYPGQDVHVHEDNLPVSSTSRPSSSIGSVHTTIIRSPRKDIDNRSPLPIAFDNFTTKGVRGNIASVGAIEPDRPRPPIYPIIKRTPSPNVMER